MSDASRRPAETEIRALSPRALRIVVELGALGDGLAAHPGQASDRLARPHPLLLLLRLRRAEYSVRIAPAALWEHGRELLGPRLDRGPLQTNTSTAN